MGVPDPADDTLARLRQKAVDLGASDEELRVALERGTLGPLSLDLATRGDGASHELDTFIESVAGDADLARRLWVALGLPTSGPIPRAVTPGMAETLRLLEAMAGLLGEEAVLALARVVGQSTARTAEALSDAFRVGSEVPALQSGVAYADVVDGYIDFTREMLPRFLDALGAVFQRHLVVVSHQGWTAEEGGTAVIRDRTVGFADLVGSTEVLLDTSVAELAELVRAFEALTWEVVTRRGGRVVKLIGDEAMFVFEDPGPALEAAVALAAASPHPVRIGLARGAVVGIHGDYYGTTVNLAARLVRAAEPDTLLVSDAVRHAVSDNEWTAVDLGPLKGFPGPVPAFRLHT